MKGDKVGRPHEEWRTCPLDETVELSSRGRVKRHGKISKAKAKDKDGYRRITIKGKSYGLHRLIAELFIPNPDNLPVVDHRNNIHDDNRVENLRWCTQKDNVNYAADMGLLTRYKNDKSVVILIDKDNVGHMFTTIADCAREFEIDSARVSMAIVGKAKRVNGYKIIRVDELFDKRRVYKGE